MMKRILLTLGIMLLSLGVLAACSSDSDSDNENNNQNEEVNDAENNQTPDDQTNGTDENEVDENTEDDGNNGSDNQEGDTSSGDFSDQKDLKIGDTGQVESTLGKYEITIDSIKKEDEIDGKPSQLDYFFVTDVTIKNIGDAPIEAKDSKGNLEITQMLEGSGFSDVANFFDSIEEIEGTLEPGESISGQMLFEEEEADAYYIRLTEGLVAAGALKNQVIWTFTLDEVDK